MRQLKRCGFDLYLNLFVKSRISKPYLRPLHVFQENVTTLNRLEEEDDGRMESVDAIRTDLQKSCRVKKPTWSGS